MIKYISGLYSSRVLFREHKINFFLSFVLLYREVLLKQTEALIDTLAERKKEINFMPTRINTRIL
jgi:hypothetical protein